MQNTANRGCLKIRPKSKEKDMAKLRVIELFAGIGAQAQALNRIGADWESVDMVEIDPYCVTAYNAIFKTDYKPQDITKVEHLKPCDMLT